MTSWWQNVGWFLWNTIDLSPLKGYYYKLNWDGFLFITNLDGSYQYSTDDGAHLVVILHLGFVDEIEKVYWVFFTSPYPIY